MTKLEEILRAYARMFKPTDDQKFIAKERLATCIECEDWVQGKVLDYCVKCKCATSGKVFSPVGGKACPMGKWIR